MRVHAVELGGDNHGRQSGRWGSKKEEKEPPKVSDGADEGRESSGLLGGCGDQWGQPLGEFLPGVEEPGVYRPSSG